MLASLEEEIKGTMEEGEVGERRLQGVWAAGVRLRVCLSIPKVSGLGREVRGGLLGSGRRGAKVLSGLNRHSHFEIGVHELLELRR